MNHPWRVGHGGPGGGTVEPWPIATRWGAALSPSYYEIRVTGVLPPEILVDFERLSASVEPVETVVHGPLSDQAALYGLLARLETFGVQVVEVRRMHDPSPPDPPG
jgi:hypothetical protein